MGKRRRVAERRRTKRPAVLGGVAAVVVAGGAFGAYSLYGGRRGRGRHLPRDRAHPGEDRPADGEGDPHRVHRLPRRLAEGDVAKAAAATDDATAARTALTGYAEDARITGVELTGGAPSGADVPFTVKASVAYRGTAKPLAYSSELTVVRRPEDGAARVGWKPSVLHPDLRDGDRLVTGASGTPPVTALDRDGGELTAARYPSLGTVLDGLREKYGKTAGGKAGIELRVVRKAAKKGGRKTPDKTLLTLTEGRAGKVTTTLSPALQAEAERLVAAESRASVVLLRPSTGEILAVANSSHGFNTAFQGSLAPGSTMKVITASLLFDKHLASADKPHPCPKTSTYGGWKFHNDDDFEIRNGTFKASFARSCNTAFITQAKKLGNDDLTKQAQQVFGLSRNNWSIGVPSFDGSVPVQSAAPMAASLMGQGGVRMNPLNMASVAATVKSGSFHQPYLVSPDVDHRTLATASRTLSASTLAQLREVMQYTAAAGTAAEAMSGLGPDYGAKTGSAEVDHQKEPNGWFTAWKGDLAGAGVVQQGGHGGDTAGPIVAALLKAGG